MLELEHLCFRHPGQPDGYEFTMSAARGEITAISGASGSGKSTLLDLIAGFASPTDGHLTLDGRDLLSLRPEQRPISILFQSETLFEHLTAEQNLRLALRHEVPKSLVRTRVEQALLQVGLPEIGAQRSATLSGGQKQRVALARTILLDRPVLLLDEPFSALDDATRSAVRLLVADITRQQNWVTILVSHHEDDIAMLAARRYHLDAGRLLLG